MTTKQRHQNNVRKPTSSRLKMIHVVMDSLEEKGHDLDLFEDKNINEIEDLLKIGHCRIHFVHSGRSGYINRSASTPNMIDETMKYLINH